MSRRVLPVPPPPSQSQSAARNDLYYTRKLNDLTNVLSDTNENISEIDRELSKSRVRKKYQEAQYDRLDDDYYNVNNRNKRTTAYPKHMKPSISDTEDEYYAYTRQKNRRNVVFRDDLNESLHELHQQVRDLSFEHEKLADQVNSELVKTKYDKDSKRWQSVIENGHDSTSSIEKKMEKRFTDVLDKVKREKGDDNLRDEIKTTLEEFRKVNKEDIQQLKLAIIESDKQKVETELKTTKQRLVEIEDSKTSLATQVQQLRDQLNRFESHNMQNQLASRHLGVDSNVKGTCKCYLEKELDGVIKPKFSDSTTEVVRAIEKYEKQKDYLADHNQALKRLLDEKESYESQLNAEIKLLNDKTDKYEKQNGKLQIDLEIALNKLQEITQEAEKYANALRNAEEQLNISEYKRNELKQDAQETVKLWKTKVKKLEKALDKYKSDSLQIGEQNEQLKNKHSTYITQLENKIKELTSIKDAHSNLDERLNVREIEINHLKVLCDELKNQNESFKHEINETRLNNKQYENRLFSLQSEKSDLERQLLIESEKYRDLLERFNSFEVEMTNSNDERKNLEIYVNKLEQECQRLKASLNNLEKVGSAARNDLNSISMQAIQNKETYEDKILKLSRELQKTQYQLQKVKLECEDNIRLSQVQLVEERSKLELFKKRENEYLKEIDELKEQRRKFEDDLLELQSNYEKLARNDNEKNKQLLDYEEKFNRMISEMSDQKNTFYSKESEYWQILNTLNVDIDLINGLLTAHANELYKPINIIDDTEKDKAKSFYLFMKSKLNWIGKEMELHIQKECKLQQNLIFLEHELEKLKKKTTSNLKTHGLSLKQLEDNNYSLESEKSLAYKNMELLQNYLLTLSDSLKTHSLKELERTHHLIAVDNVLNICNNDSLSQVEKDDIYDRFKQFTNTINDIKYQLKSSKLDSDENNINIKRDYSTKVLNNKSTYPTKDTNKHVKINRQKTIHKI